MNCDVIGHDVTIHSDIWNERARSILSPSKVHIMFLFGLKNLRRGANDGTLNSDFSKIHNLLYESIVEIKHQDINESLNSYLDDIMFYHLKWQTS